MSNLTSVWVLLWAKRGHILKLYLYFRARRSIWSPPVWCLVCQTYQMGTPISSIERSKIRQNPQKSSNSREWKTTAKSTNCMTKIILKILLIFLQNCFILGWRRQTSIDSRGYERIALGQSFCRIYQTTESLRPTSFS